MKLKQLLLIAALVMPFSVGAATTANWDGSSLLGLNDVDVNGTLYDVTLNETYQAGSVYGDAFALAASTSLLDLFITGGTFSGANYDTSPQLADGCSHLGSCGWITAGTTDETNLSGRIFINEALGGSRTDNDRLSTISSTLNFSHVAYTFATWTASDVSAVPLPAAVWLFGPALLGFMGFRRKAVDTVA